MGKIKKAVIPAAGLGTRFYPLTRAQPKEMLPLLDKPVIHYVVEEAVLSGLDEILIIVGAGKNAIIDYFDTHHLDSRFDNNGFDDLPEVYFVRQREQKGLADSIKYAEKFVGGDPFVVLLGDTVYRSGTDKTVTSQLIDTFDRQKSPVIAVEEVPMNKVQDYGIIAGTKLDQKVWDVTSMVEKPRPDSAPSNIGITGTYVLTHEIFGFLKDLKPGSNGEFQLTDALSEMCHSSRVLGYEFEGSRYDIGTKELWVKAFFEFAKQDERFKNYLK